MRHEHFQLGGAKMEMTQVFRRTILALLIVTAAAGQASAVFFPAVQRPTEKQIAKQRKVGYWASIGDEAMRSFMQVVGGLALNLDYRHGWQDADGKVSRLPNSSFRSETDLDTYTARPEIVFTNWLSTYFIFGVHDGESESPTATLDLDGFPIGAGLTMAVGLPAYTPDLDKDITIDPFFVAPEFNWTHNEFDDVDTSVNVYNITTRIGAAVRSDHYYLGLYAGPQYQASTRDQTVRLNGLPIDIEVEPREAWSGVVGSFFGVMFGKPKKLAAGQAERPNTQRPDLLLTVEGGVGNRAAVLVSLRYEHNLLENFTRKK